MRLLIGLFLLFITFCAPVRAEEYRTASYEEHLLLIVDAVNGAQKSIQASFYVLPKSPISLALLSAHSRGIKVRIVADMKTSSGQNSIATYLATQNVPIRLSRKFGISLNQFVMIIDGQRVQTGNVLFTIDKNAKNIITLDEDPEFVEETRAKWERLWRYAKEVVVRKF
jgi:phosphatidylserine/phosphatidylglycerophosphate/cardiolipin synthase-like enzyme